MTVSAQIKLKTIALPAEHGGWGFLLEPILLGLLIHPSWAGLALGFGVFGLFLIRQPLKITLTDWRRQRRFARTRTAERFLVLYSLLSIVGFAIAVHNAGWNVLVPLLLSTPLMAVQIAYDAFNRGRSLLPEMLGPVALAASSAGIVLAGAGTSETAFAAWAILIARAVPSILYVRARLRVEYGETVSPLPALLSQTMGVLVVGTLALISAVPWLSVVALIILLLRAALGLSSHRAATTPKMIGFREIAYGLLIVLATAVGYAAHL